MKPLIVLLVVFVIALVAAQLAGYGWNYIFAGNAAMSAMLLFTSIGHFKFPKGMMMMIPSFIPYRETMVYLTGLFEIAAAVGLLIVAMRDITGLLLIIFFIAILPANIHAALQKVDYEKASFEGKGLAYLWFRVPLQLLFITWVWYFSL